MTDLDALKIALREARSVVNCVPFDAPAALQAVRQLSMASPPSVSALAKKAEQAVGAAIGSSSSYDALAVYAMTRLIGELERTLFRVID